MPKETKIPAVCVPCEDGDLTHLIPLSELDAYIEEVTGWELNDEKKKISKNWTFRDFVQAMQFVEQVADIAEETGHHPDIIISYNKVRLELSTHAVSGLTENDFVVASRVDRLWLVV